LYRNSNNNEETYYSEKELKARRLYHVAIRSNHEEISNLHSISLMVNGYDDLKTTISHYKPFDMAQILVGQYRTISSFNGILQNMILFLYPMIDEEISAMT